MSRSSWSSGSCCIPGNCFFLVSLVLLNSLNIKRRVLFKIGWGVPDRTVNGHLKRLQPHGRLLLAVAIDSPLVVKVLVWVLYLQEIVLLIPPLNTQNRLFYYTPLLGRELGKPVYNLSLNVLLGDGHKNLFHLVHRAEVHIIFMRKRTSNPDFNLIATLKRLPVYVLGIYIALGRARVLFWAKFYINHHLLGLND